MDIAQVMQACLQPAMEAQGECKVLRAEIGNLVKENDRLGKDVAELASNTDSRLDKVEQNIAKVLGYLESIRDNVSGTTVIQQQSQEAKGGEGGKSGDNFNSQQSGAGAKSSQAAKDVVEGDQTN